MKKTGSSLCTSVLTEDGETTNAYLSLLPAAAVLAAGAAGLVKDAFPSWSLSVPVGAGVVCVLCTLLSFGCQKAVSSPDKRNQTISDFLFILFITRQSVLQQFFFIPDPLNKKKRERKHDKECRQ